MEIEGGIIDNSLLDLHNFSDDIQLDEIMAKYFTNPF